LKNEADLYRALSLQERWDLWRQTPQHLPQVVADETTQRRLQQWLQQSPFSTDDWLDRRLAAEGLDQDSFETLQALSGEELRQRCEAVPEWLESLEQAFANGHDPQASELPPLPRDKGSISLVHLVQPLFDIAGERLIARAREIVRETDAPFDPVGIAGMFFSRQVPRVAGMIGRIVVLELHVARLEGKFESDSSAGRFSEYIDMLERPDYRLQILREYPVLGRVAATTVRQWEEASIEFLEHFGRDWQRLERTFSPERPAGTLKSVLIEAGDRHRGGRTVVELRYSSGLRLVYKPRPLSIDVPRILRDATEPDRVACRLRDTLNLSLISKPQHVRCGIGH